MDASREQVTSADGTRIGFERMGQGPPLVAIHGGVADRTRWLAVAGALAEAHTLILLDRRGRGLSADEAEGGYALGREVDDLDAVIAAVGGSARVLAHSYGGLVALEAMASGSALERAVIYEPAFDTPGQETFPPTILGRVDELIGAGEREAALELFFREVVGADDAMISSLKETPVWAARVAAVHTITREGVVVRDVGFDPGRFADLNVPVRLLIGSESPEPLKASTRAAHAAVPGSELVELEGQGHAAMDTGTEAFLSAVLEFLH
ncbi:MAG TPA: alpha/beta hydrolase [Solirubrobacterales bacterium]